jgi:hypothetical protein
MNGRNFRSTTSFQSANKSPRVALLKALIIDGTDSDVKAINPSKPTAAQGYGRVNLQRSLRNIVEVSNSGLVEGEPLSWTKKDVDGNDIPGDVWTKSFDIPKFGPNERAILRVTMAFTDRVEFSVLQSSLSLSVTSGGQTMRNNTGTANTDTYRDGQTEFRPAHNNVQRVIWRGHSAGTCDTCRAV